MFKRPDRQNGRQQRTPRETATSRSRVFSYYNSRAPRDADSGRNNVGKPVAKVRSSTHWWNHLPTWIAVFAIIFCVIYELRLSNDPRVIILDKTSNSQPFLNSVDHYQQSIHDVLISSRSNDNKLSIDTNSLESRLESKFPELSSVSIVLPILGNRPLVYLEPATPDIILDSQVSGNFVLDSTGKVLFSTSSPATLAGLKLPTVTDQTGFAVKVGEVALPSVYISFIENVVGQLQAQQISIQSLVLPSASEELDVHIVGVPYFVKFNLNDSSDASQQIGTFLAARQYLVHNNITPSQYIDARIIGRVYYK